MKTILAITASAVLLSCSPVLAWGSKTYNHGGDANASASASAGAIAGANAQSNQKQRQKQTQGQSQSTSVDSTNRNVNRNSINNSDTTVIEGDDIPAITGSVTAVLGSMVNDRCGRVALGVPFSAYTCNVLMEAEAMQDMLTPIRGEVVAAQTALLHAARLDRTIRETLLAAGIVKLTD